MTEIIEEMKKQCEINKDEVVELMKRGEEKDKPT